MTKKHFIALADTMKANKPAAHWDANKMVQWQSDVAALADFCAGQNANFNRERWMGYLAGECGPSGGKVKTK